MEKKLLLLFQSKNNSSFIETNNYTGSKFQDQILISFIYTEIILIMVLSYFYLITHE